MASIQERLKADGSVGYRVMFRIGGKQVGETFDSAVGAHEFADMVTRYGGEMAREILSSRDQDANEATPTVQQWCRTHVDMLSGITTGTRRDYIDIINRSIAMSPIGALPVDALTKRHVAAWVREQAEAGRSGKTIRNRHALLSAAMTTAIDHNYVGSNPCRGVRIPQTVQASRVFLTRGEYGILEHHMPARWKPFTMVLVGTGLRFSEATALQVGDVHLDDEVPNLRVERSFKWTDGGPPELGPPKTRKGIRTVSLSNQVVDVLRPLTLDREPDEFLFTTVGGNPVRNVDFREDGWNKALTGARATHDAVGTKIPADRRLTKRPRIHDLRHTHASWLIAQGVPLPVIQYRLGHESIKTTVDVYGHLAEGALALAAEATSAAFDDHRPTPIEQSPAADGVIDVDILDDETEAA